MRKLLRSRSTKAFLKEDGTWTDDITQALALTEHSDIRQATQNLTPLELEIYYCFGENGRSQWDFAIPLH